MRCRVSFPTAFLFLRTYYTLLRVILIAVFRKPMSQSLGLLYFVVLCFPPPVSFISKLAVLYDTWRQGDDGRSSSSSSSVKVCEQEATASKQLEHCKQKKEEEDDWDKEDDRGSLMFSYAVLTTSAAPRVTWLHERWGKADRA